MAVCHCVLFIVLLCPAWLPVWVWSDWGFVCLCSALSKDRVLIGSGAEQISGRVIRRKVFCVWNDHNYWYNSFCRALFNLKNTWHSVNTNKENVKVWTYQKQTVTNLYLTMYEVITNHNNHPHGKLNDRVCTVYGVQLNLIGNEVAILNKQNNNEMGGSFVTPQFNT